MKIGWDDGSHLGHGASSAQASPFQIVTNLAVSLLSPPWNLESKVRGDPFLPLHNERKEPWGSLSLQTHRKLHMLILQIEKPSPREGYVLARGHTVWLQGRLARNPVFLDLTGLSDGTPLLSLQFRCFCADTGRLGFWFASSIRSLWRSLMLTKQLPCAGPLARLRSTGSLPGGRVAADESGFAVHCMARNPGCDVLSTDPTQSCGMQSDLGQPLERSFWLPAPPSSMGLSS